MILMPFQTTPFSTLQMDFDPWLSTFKTVTAFLLLLGIGVLCGIFAKLFRI
jgi:hypothetical protein